MAPALDAGVTLTVGGARSLVNPPTDGRSLTRTVVRGGPGRATAVPVAARGRPAARRGLTDAR